MQITLTATPEGNYPNPSSNNEVRVKLTLTSSNKDTLRWGGRPLIFNNIGGTYYLYKMRKKSETIMVELRNHKKPHKPPKGKLTVNVHEHCFTKNFVKNCSEREGSTHVTTVN